MLLGLSELLRTSLDRGKEPLTSVEAEVDFVRRYIELQRGRFADRLTVIYEVNDDCLSCMVPTLSLQPLVENALRHGVARRRGPGRLEVAVYREADVLHLRSVTMESASRLASAWLGAPAWVCATRRHAWRSSLATRRVSTSGRTTAVARCLRSRFPWQKRCPQRRERWRDDSLPCRGCRR